MQFVLHPAFAYPGHPLNSWPVYTVIDPEGPTFEAIQLCTVSGTFIEPTTVTKLLPGKNRQEQDEKIMFDTPTNNRNMAVCLVPVAVQIFVLPVIVANNYLLSYLLYRRRYKYKESRRFSLFGDLLWIQSILFLLYVVFVE